MAEMRELHTYIVRRRECQGVLGDLSAKLTAVLVVCGLVLAPGPQAGAVPGVCPPICNAIPDSAWIVSTDVPLYRDYHWPGLPGLAVTAPAPRFAFEDVCAITPAVADARDYAVAARATVVNPDGHWQLQAQILHWRGDTGQAGPIASATLEAARASLRACQATAPLTSPSITTDDPQRIAAVISVAGRRVVHQYLLVHPSSSTVVELALWSTLPPQVAWPGIGDDVVLDAMAAPLCNTYLGSCR
jgi:hypothetical protein